MADLPLVLAGPVLRRVDAQRVSVWLALSKPGSVTLTVFRGRATSTAATAPADMPEVGTQAGTPASAAPTCTWSWSTWRSPGMPPLTRHCTTWWSTPTGRPRDSRRSGCSRTATGTPKPLALGYAPDLLPSFVTPAADVDGPPDRPHVVPQVATGPGPDALAWLDDRIQAGTDRPRRRRRSSCSSPATRSTPTTWAGCCCRCSPSWEGARRHRRSSRSVRTDLEATLRALPGTAPPERRTQARAASPPPTGTTTCSPTASSSRCTAPRSARRCGGRSRPPRRLFTPPPADAGHHRTDPVGGRLRHDRELEVGEERGGTQPPDRGHRRGATASRPGATPCPRSRGCWPTCRPT